MVSKTAAYKREPHTSQEVGPMLPQIQRPQLSAYYLPENEKERVPEYTEVVGGTVEESFHLACQTGNLEYVKFLVEKGSLEDVNGPLCGFHGGGNGLLTPLCCGVIGRSCEVVSFLLDYGSDWSVLCGGNSPLHFAAMREDNAAVVQILLKAGASHGVKNAKGQTPLYLAASASGPESVKILLQIGADPNVSDATGRTPLHAAAANASKTGVECVRLLLENGGIDVNSQDEYGYTAMHLSAMNESSKIAALLLQHGGDVTLKTSSGVTALSMLVSKLPNSVGHLIRRLDSGVILHDFDPTDANCEIKMDFNVLIPPTRSRRSFSRKKKLSPDHIDNFAQQQQQRKETELLTCLVSTGHKKLLAHPLSEAFLLLKWRRVRKFFLASLLFQMALVALFTVFVVEVYLIRCPYRRQSQEDATTQEAHTISKRHAYPYPGPHPDPRADPEGFHWFRVVPSKKKDKTPENPQYPHHPVHPHLPPSGAGALPYPSTTYRPKVPAMLPFDPQIYSSVANIPSPGIPTSAFAPSGERRKSFGPPSNSTDESSLSEAQFETAGGNEEEAVTEKVEEEDTSAVPECSITLPLQIIWILLVSCIGLMALQEIFQLIHSPSRYVISSENWAQWLLISSVLITAWKGTSSADGTFQLAYWQYPAAACGILIAWGLILFQVGRFPSLGLYVEMLGKVAANFGLFILAYACLLIAFALSFCVLFPEHPPFSSVPLSILKVFTMMVGEVDYEDLFYSEERSNDPILFPITAHLLFGAFVLIMTIVLMNLLVGLAVSDIQGLQKGAKLDRLCRQNALIARFESFIFSKKLQTIMPASLIRVIQENSLLSLDPHSKEKFSFCFRPNDPRDRILPKHIKQAALRLIISSSTSISPPKITSSHKNSDSFAQKSSKLKRSLSSSSHYHNRYLEYRSESNQSSSSNNTASTDNHLSYHHHHPLTSSISEENTRLSILEVKLSNLETNVAKILTILGNMSTEKH